MLEKYLLAYPQSIDFSNRQLLSAQLKQSLNNFQLWSIGAFESGCSIEQLIQTRSDYIDYLLQQLWLGYGLVDSKENQLSLIAVGGYGRRELHPLSDIDLLILSNAPLNQQQKLKISELLALLWDIKLEVGHSVRTLSQCLAEAETDLTIMTNAMESRLVIGDQTLLAKLQTSLFNGQIWPSANYFYAKLDEQKKRHLRYHDTSYNLQPDIKNGPGGLRDIHTLQWVALRQFGVSSLDKMDITPQEITELKQCQHFLWRMRFALHCEISRPDNRLLFDRQLNVAQRLGYTGERNKPVEDMMRDFYHTVHTVNELNEMLLQLFEATTVPSTNHAIQSYDLDDYFYSTDQKIAIKDSSLFIQQPAIIMQMFYLLANHPELIDIEPNTLRQLRYARAHLTTYLCQLPQARKLFMTILRHPNAVTGALLPMHKHGILSVYIPQWQQITGLMQFDLFHAYTVDEHTIRVLLNIDGLAKSENRIYPTLSRPEILLIAALFHDIAKGRNGDHSELGAIDVEQFVKLHELSEKNTQRITWLVKNHLLMSGTAQGQDIQDPTVIKTFATKVGNHNRLQYLLCLTIADICATNPNLWNSWKESLLKELYFSTEKQLDRGIQNIPDQRDIARQNRQDALDLLQLENITQSMIEPIWQQCRVDYFFRHSPDQLAWHTRHLVNHDLTKPLILISPRAYRGGTEIFIYAPDRPFLFAAVSGELDARNLDIHAAQIFTNRQGMAMDTFIVLQPNGKTLATDRHNTICDALIKIIRQKEYTPPRKRRALAKPRRAVIETEVRFLTTQTDKKTYVELITMDQPGLLARVGEVFANLNLSLHSARIATIGERVEDFFVLTDCHQQALDGNLCQLLSQQLIEAVTANSC